MSASKRNTSGGGPTVRSILVALCLVGCSTAQPSASPTVPGVATVSGTADTPAPTPTASPGPPFCVGTPVKLVHGGEIYVGWPTAVSKSFANVEGSMYFHPVATAFNAIRALVAGDRDAARVYADLLYRHAEDGWLAYDFDWEWPTANIIEAPWYSALAQALALTVYSRLGQRERADEAFETVIEMQRDDGWLPEYPAGPDVLNGHIFATLGLYDYWEFTGRGESATLAAVRVLADRVHEWRRPGTISRYAGEYPAYGIYHGLHVMLLDWMESITANPCFADAARAFEGDFTGP